MAIIKCPECGHQISDKAPVCPSCGVEIAGKVIKCPNCGEVYFKVRRCVLTVIDLLIRLRCHPLQTQSL